MRTQNTIVMNRNIKFGVEIEYVNRDANAALIREAAARGVTVVDAGYTHEVRSCWKIVSDGSCGYEAVSPVLKGVAGLDELRRMCEAMEAAGCKVDRTCGLHVHHDAADLDLPMMKNLFKLYEKYTAQVDSMMPRSRRACRWAANFEGWQWTALNSSDFQTALRQLTDGDYRSHKRYYKLNVCSYLKHKTVEFRQHSGTINYEKISNWVLITHMMMERAANRTEMVKATTAARLAQWQADERHMMYDFYKELGISGTRLAAYVRARKAILNGNNAEAAA